MSRKIAIALVLAAAITGLQADAKPLKSEQEAKIKPAGAPVSCVPLRSIRYTRVRDDSTIDFYLTGNRVYRNKLPHRCSSLGFEERFSYATSLSQLCSVDTIRVLQTPPGIGGPPWGFMLTYQQ